MTLVAGVMQAGVASFMVGLAVGVALGAVVRFIKWATGSE